MPIKIKRGGVYVDPIGIWVKRAGVYVAVSALLVKVLGAYVPVLSDTVPASASVRTRMNMTSSAHSAGFEFVSHRVRHKTNVSGTNVFSKFWNGYNVSTGAAGLLDQERGVGNAVQYEWMYISGVGENIGADLSGVGTVRRMTFFGMLSDSAFVAAGGTVSGDGYTITVPDNFEYRSDKMSTWTLSRFEKFFTVCTKYCAAGQRSPSNITSHNASVGDYYFNSATGMISGRQLSANANWTGTTPGTSNQYGAFAAPMSIWCDAPAGTITIGVDGDSIITEIVGSSALGLTPVDLGDSDGCQNFAKRALNAMGYSFVCVGVSGTRVRDLRDFQPGAMRARHLNDCEIVITDHLHNDRDDLHSFNHSVGLGTLYTFHNNWLKSALKGQKRIVRCSLLPGTWSRVQLTALTSSGTVATATAPSHGYAVSQLVAVTGNTPTGFNVNDASVLSVPDANTITYTIPNLSGVPASVLGYSSDGWIRSINQTYKNDACKFPAGGEASANGTQYQLMSKILRTGEYASLAYGGAGECDAGFNLYQHFGDASGLFAANGTRYYMTDDGTHGKLVGHLAADAALRPLLATLLGYVPS